MEIQKGLWNPTVWATLSSAPLNCVDLGRYLDLLCLGFMICEMGTIML
jgi:hypothetical protein